MKKVLRSSEKLLNVFVFFQKSVSYCRLLYFKLLDCAYLLVIMSMDLGSMMPLSFQYIIFILL